MDFNKQKFLKLLQESEKLREQNKFLRDSDPARYGELSQYQVFLEDNIFWRSRLEYCQMLDSFANQKMMLDELFDKFYSLRASNLEVITMWEEIFKAEACGSLPPSKDIGFKFHPQSSGFTRIISSLHSVINLCEPEITLDMNLEKPDLIGYGISEELLRRNIKNNFLPRIAAYCNKS